MIRGVSGGDVRRVALSFPEAVEKHTWGQRTSRVRERFFAMMDESGASVRVKASA
jgi:hypothetical protein